jgi:hypothetical protein
MDKAQQAPEDKMIDFDDEYSSSSKSTAASNTGKSANNAIHSRAGGKNEALQLEKFMGKSCPVMEQVVEENE